MSATTSSRARRARVLVVADAGAAATVGAALHGPPVQVNNVLEAIGEIATCPAGDPIVAAVLFDSAAGRAGTAVEALRRVDPSVVIVRVADRNGAAAPPSAGYDAVVHPPIEARALAAALGDDLVRGGASMPAPTPAPGAESTPARGGPSEEIDALVLEPADHPAPPASVTHDLGDTDLVDAVMHDPGGVTTTALNLIRQQTGWRDLDLVDAAARADRPAAAVADDRLLVATSAPPGALEPWARWLSHWLALDTAYRRYRLLAYRDDLTGAWNRRYFDRFLTPVIEEAARRRRPVSVMVFDIDDFKRYNDEFGHEAGDEILCETVSLLQSVIRRCDRVCRIGGDEFAVIFADLDEPRSAGSVHPESVEFIARRFQAQVCTMQFPKLGAEARGALSISAGLSTFPWDANTPDELLRLADERAMESKRRGKNHITFGPEVCG